MHRDGNIYSYCLALEHLFDRLADPIFGLEFEQLDARLGRHPFGVFAETGLYPGGHLVAERDNGQLQVYLAKTQKTLALERFSKSLWLECLTSSSVSLISADAED